MFTGLIGRRTLLIFAIFLNSIAAFSQRIIELKYEPDSKGGYVFSCFNYAYCNYIIAVGFTSFDNLKCDRSLPFQAEVKPGYNKLFTISAIRAQEPVQFKYNSTYQKGCMSPDVNREFTYLLPIAPGMNAQVYEMSPDKSIDSTSWYVIRMKMKPGDTIFAARKGVVNMVHDQDGANDAGQMSIGKENFVEIVQADCSFARYGILKKNTSLVKPGQSVRAGQPIGLVGGDAFGRGSDIRFSVYYYREENGVLNQTASSHYILTQFWTKNNGKGRLKHGAVYVSEFPATILNQEMPAQGKKKTKGKK